MGNNTRYRWIASKFTLWTTAADDVEMNLGVMLTGSAGAGTNSPMITLTDGDGVPAQIFRDAVQACVVVTDDFLATSLGVSTGDITCPIGTVDTYDLAVSNSAAFDPVDLPGVNSADITFTSANAKVANIVRENVADRLTISDAERIFLDAPDIVLNGTIYELTTYDGGIRLDDGVGDSPKLEFYDQTNRYLEIYRNDTDNRSCIFDPSGDIFICPNAGAGTLYVNGNIDCDCPTAPGSGTNIQAKDITFRENLYAKKTVTDSALFTLTSANTKTSTVKRTNVADRLEIVDAVGVYISPALSVNGNVTANAFTLSASTTEYVTPVANPSSGFTAGAGNCYWVNGTGRVFIAFDGSGGGLPSATCYLSFTLPRNYKTGGTIYVTWTAYNYTAGAQVHVMNVTHVALERPGTKGRYAADSYYKVVGQSSTINTNASEIISGDSVELEAYLDDLVDHAGNPMTPQAGDKVSVRYNVVAGSTAAILYTDVPSVKIEIDEV